MFPIVRAPISKCFLVCLLSLLGRIPLQAEVRLASLFGDHAVLQQGKPVPVWGWAAPGGKVEVEFKGNKVETTAAETGRWQVSLPALSASAEGTDLVVRTGETTLTVRDVLVGEVWLCSGQSNMEWRVDQANNAEKEMAEANFPLIRQFRVPKSYKDKPVEDVSAQWTPSSPKTVGMFSAVAYFFARDLYQNLKVPIGLINASFGGKMIETFMSPEAMAGSSPFQAIAKRWEDERARLPAQLALWEKSATEGGRPKGMDPRIVVDQHRPGCLFNAMLSPLFPYAIRGMIWYQGEHNIARAEEYASLFPAFIKDMREKFGQGDFPFYYVQLANFDAKLDKSREGYAKLREVQRETLALPQTGMAVTIDIGTPENVHPKNKQDVGARLARWAKARTYGLGGIESGPLFKSATREGSSLRLKFDFSGGGLFAAKEPVEGFEIAGAEGKFVPATAKIDGESVVVQADGVTEPVMVRYAWANAPVASIFNKERLPASPFRAAIPSSAP